MTPGSSSRTLWPAVLLLGVALAGFELTGFDLAVQDRLYDFGARRWIVDGHEPAGRLYFYNGPKAVIILAGGALLILALGPARWRQRFRFDRRGLWVGFLTLASVPALAGWGKAVTNTFCPSEIRRYGGDAPYVKVFESYPAGDRPERHGRGFPAGHASGGFALMGLAWLRPSAAWRRGAIALGLAVGWWMGGYQMLKGAHYLSHTVTTMLLAWIVMCVWSRALQVKEAAG